MLHMHGTERYGISTCAQVANPLPPPGRERPAALAGSKTLACPATTVCPRLARVDLPLRVPELQVEVREECHSAEIPRRLRHLPQNLVLVSFRTQIFREYSPRSGGKPIGSGGGETREPSGPGAADLCVSVCVLRFLVIIFR